MSEEIKSGLLAHKDGKYVVQVEGQPEAIEVTVGLLENEERLRSLVGQHVDLLYSNPKPQLVGLMPKKAISHCYFILCYVPIPDLLKGYKFPVTPVVDVTVRKELATKLFKEGTISQEVFNKMQGTTHV